MVDLMTAGTAAGVASIAYFIERLGGKELIIRVLGPAADYLGEEAQEWAEKKVENTKKVFQKADRKLKDIEQNVGGVSPRVLKSVFDEAPYCEDEIVQEYLAGLLASSKGSIVNDEGVYISHLIKTLSARQIKLHYSIYKLFQDNYVGEINPYIQTELDNQKIYISAENLVTLLGLESQELDRLLTSDFYILNHGQLVGQSFSFGSIEHLRKRYPNLPDKITKDGIVFSPSLLGIELFLWANGYGLNDKKTFFEKSFTEVTPIKLLEPIIIFKN